MFQINNLDLMQSVSSAMGKPVGVAKATASGGPGCGEHFTMLKTFQTALAKGHGKGWYHGNQHHPGATSVKAVQYLAKMKEARTCAKSGDRMGSKLAENEAYAIWKKMAVGERGHAMKMVSDSGGDDIGKSRDCSFEFGHGKRVK